MDRTDAQTGLAAARRSDLGIDAYARIARRSGGGATGIRWANPARSLRASRTGLRRPGLVGHITWAPLVRS